MTEFVFVLFMNGWPVEVDRFKTLEECHEKVTQYNKAAKQAGSPLQVWCEQKKVDPKKRT